MPYKLLIINDNKEMEDVREKLMNQGYTVDVADNAEYGLELTEKVKPDLIFTTYNLPNYPDGALVKEIKDLYEEMPVIAIYENADTEESENTTIATAVEQGSDDHIQFPIDSHEFVNRTKAILKNHYGTDTSPQTLGDLTLNHDTFIAERQGKEIELSPTEYRLLRYLMQNRNKVLSREQILRRVWGYTTDVETRVVDVYVGYLRKKIDEPFDTNLIQTRKGFGYYVEEPDETSSE